MMNKPYKILMYTDTPLYGGAEKQMFLLASHLDHDQFEPIIVCRSVKELQKWHQSIEKAVLPLYTYDSENKNSIGNFFALNKIIKSEKPDLIHIHVWNPVACKWAFLSARKAGIPIVITEHDPFAVSGFRKIYKKFSLRLSKKIITVSKDNQALMAQLYPTCEDKLTTVHNGISPLIKNITEVDKIRIKKQVFESGKETFIIFSAGTLHSRKGYKYLFSAFKKAGLQSKNVKIIIAGEGPARQDLEKLGTNLGLSKKIVLLGQRDDVEKLMQAADLFVLPSLKEAFGLVILEAMQNGLPIIATKVGGIPEIIDSARYGILVPPKNTTILSKALTKLYKDDKLRSEMSLAGKNRVKNFSAQSMANKTMEIYHQVLK